MRLTGVQRAIRHLVVTAFMLFTVLRVMFDAHAHYFLLDFVPEHFQRLRESLSGELGLAAAFGCFFI